MPQRRSSSSRYTIPNPNAEIIQAMLAEMGKTIGEGIKEAAMNRFREQQVKGAALQKIKDFMSLPPEKRKELLAVPAFRRDMLETLDPHVFSKHKPAKEGPAPTEADVSKLGEPTQMEQLQTKKMQSDIAEQQAKEAKAKSEQKMQEMKQGLAEGTIKPNPMNLAIAGDIKDPIANALFSLIPEDELKRIAETHYNQGPEFQKQEEQKWFKYFVDEGMPAGDAIRNGIAVAAGDWGKVDGRFRGKVEKQLAIDALNAKMRAQEINATISNQRAQLTSQIAQSAGMTLSDAQKAADDLRAGRTPRVDTTTLQQLKAFDLVSKQQEVEKNRQTILNDQEGIGVIRDTLSQMMKTYASGGAKDTHKLGEQINKIQDDLTARLAKRYGIDVTTTPSWTDTIKSAIGATWDSMKSAGAWGADIGKDAIEGVDKVLKETAKQQTLKTTMPPTDTFTATMLAAQTGGTMAMPGQFSPPTAVKRTGTFTPEQNSVITAAFKAVNDGLSNPATPDAQKEQLRKYLEQTLIPIYQDPTRFNELFIQQQFEQPQEF